MSEVHLRCSEGGLQLRRPIQLLLVVVFDLHNMDSCWSEWAHYMGKRKKIVKRLTHDEDVMRRNGRLQWLTNKHVTV